MGAARALRGGGGGRAYAIITLVRRGSVACRVVSSVSGETPFVAGTANVWEAPMTYLLDAAVVALLLAYGRR